MTILLLSQNWPRKSKTETQHWKHY